ncbi:MAG: alpha-mannosidase [Clostridia bacterium]|nr:alpha-mannosidase [Clostridia bacterium]
MKEKKKVYLVGNAHLDPVWQWRWQEGSAEAKATIRSALDRMKEFDEFRFVCSSASVYQWIEEFAPEMFEEVKQRVAEGRFTVVGGWHVQPDCNLPSGEAFARQSLYAQRYFKEKLGVTAKVGYNVDSFGHNCMLPQILKKSGMDAYIWMRPGFHEKDIETDLFAWTSPDGSSVTAYHILNNYGYNFRDLGELEKRMDTLNHVTRTDVDTAPLFYGVGNHGGGPTIRNLEVLRAYQAAHPEVALIHSDIHDFFEDVRSSGVQIPVYTEDLQHHAAGCYSTVHRIKDGIRRAETSLTAAETYHMLAAKLCGRTGAITEKMKEAWKQVCFCHFHDSMDGCSIAEVYDDADQMLGMARHTAAVTENNALQTLSWAIGTPDMEKGLPVVVFNPHSFDADQLVQVNRQYSRVTDADGNPVLSQHVHASSYECYWRRDTLFKAHVPALGYAVYYLSDGEPFFTESDAKATAFAGHRTANEHGGTILENDIYCIRFELYSGYITSFVDKRTGKELITDRAAVPVVVDEYYHDTWSHAKNFFTDQMARFCDAEVTVVENGPLRAAVKVVSRYNNSTLTQYFSLASGSDKLEVRAYADWHEKHKMLKLAWPMAVENPKAYYEIPFGVIERPADSEEEPGLMWTAVRGTDAGWAVVNNNTYSSSVKDGTIYQTILRSPIYGDHGGPRTEESEFTDQGIIKFSYTLMPLGEDFTPVTREAKLLNKPLTNIIETWHTGTLSDKPYSGLTVSAPNVMLSALKRSEDGTGMIIRLYETTGREADVTVSGDLLPIPLAVKFTPWSVNTYYLADGADHWKEVLLTEYDI